LVKEVTFAVKAQGSFRLAKLRPSAGEVSAAPSLDASVRRGQMLAARLSEAVRRRSPVAERSLTIAFRVEAATLAQDASTLGILCS
jgi:hypothetical protein